MIKRKAETDPNNTTKKKGKQASVLVRFCMSCSELSFNTINKLTNYKAMEIDSVTLASEDGEERCPRLIQISDGALSNDIGPSGWAHALDW